MLLLLSFEWGALLMTAGKKTRIDGKSQQRFTKGKLYLKDLTAFCSSWFCEQQWKLFILTNEVFHIYSCSQIGKVYYNMEKGQEGWPDWTVVSRVKSTWILLTVVLLRDEDQGQYYSTSSLMACVVCKDAPLESVVVENKACEKRTGLIQKYLGRFHKWAERSYMKSSKGKCMNNPTQLGTEWLRTVSAEKELGFLWTTGWIWVVKKSFHPGRPLHNRLY